MNITKKITIFSFLLLVFGVFGGLIDVGGNQVTNETSLGDIDMGSSTYGDFVGSVSVTNIIQDIVTNAVIVDYTPWEYSGDTTPGTQYSIVMDEPNYTFKLNSLNPYSQIASVTTNVMNPTRISFPVTGGEIVASRSEIWRNSLNLAMYSDVERVQGNLTNLENKIENMDTSYFRTNVAIDTSVDYVVCPSNQNQTVQFINAPMEIRTLKIQMPEKGETKDWLVYVLSMTNVSIVLPPATYWCASESVTNDIPGGEPTALYFSQISDDIYSIGRQKLLPITIPTPLQATFQEIRSRMMRQGRIRK